MSNPEFLRDGQAIADFMHPERVVIGADNAASRDVVHTDWEEFAALDWEQVKNAMRGIVVYDFRNLCEPARMRELGFHYFPVGGAPLAPRED